MPNNPKILITDYAWPSIEPERQVLARIGAELIVAETELHALLPTIDGILTCWKPVRENLIAAAKKCQIIARYGIGLDNIDVAAATQHGIVVTNVPAYCVDEVSDQGMALLLACARKIHVMMPLSKTEHGNKTSGHRCTGCAAKPSASSDSEESQRQSSPKRRRLGYK